MAEDMDVLVAFQGVSGRPEDQYVNTLHFRNNGSLPGEWDPGDQFLSDLRDVYWTNMQFDFGSQISGVRIKCYSAGDPKPRPVIREKLLPFVPPNGGGVAEVALCLSYYADRNLPRSRGRIYLGPFAFNTLTERPQQQLIDHISALGTGFSALGGANVDWCMRSVKNGDTHKVTNTWVDNAWDTQRRRGIRPLTRKLATVSG